MESLGRAQVMFEFGQSLTWVKKVWDASKRQTVAMMVGFGWYSSKPTIFVFGEYTHPKFLHHLRENVLIKIYSWRQQQVLPW